MIIPEFCPGDSGRKNIAKAIVNDFWLLPLPRACLACFEQQQGGKHGILSIFVAAANKPLSHQSCYQLWCLQTDERVLGLLRNQGVADFLPCSSEESQKFCLAEYMSWSALSLLATVLTIFVSLLNVKLWTSYCNMIAKLPNCQSKWHIMPWFTL